MMDTLCYLLMVNQRGGLSIYYLKRIVEILFSPKFYFLTFFDVLLYLRRTFPQLTISFLLKFPTTNLSSRHLHRLETEVEMWDGDPLIFSDFSERNNDYSDTLDFRRGEWGWSRFSFWRSLIINP